MLFCQNQVYSNQVFIRPVLEAYNDDTNNVSIHTTNNKNYYYSNGNDMIWE